MRSSIYLLAALLIFSSYGCSKHRDNSGLTSGQKDTTTKPAITKDFRDDYTGDFTVTVITSQYNSTTPAPYDTVSNLTISISYNIADSVKSYVHTDLMSVDPALHIKGLKTGPEFWAIDRVPAGKIYYERYNISGVDHPTNDGGFIGKDSIHFSYHLSGPHIVKDFLMYGHRK